MSESIPNIPPEPALPNGNSFPKTLRVRKSPEFEAVYELRQSAGDNLLVVHGRYNGLVHARLGLTVSRRVGNAVVRNRWKRSLREAFRQVRHRLPALDLVVAPRPGIQPVVAELMVSLHSLVWRVEKRLRTGAAPHPPRQKQKKRTSKAPKKPSSPESPA